jgi:hypothetical protein
MQSDDPTPLLGKQIPVTGNPTALRFYGVCECDGSLLIPFGDNRLLSTKDAAPDELRDSLVAQRWSLSLRSLMVLLEQLTCILTDRRVTPQ